MKTLLILASLTLATAAHALPTADEQFEDFQAEMLRQDQAQYQRQNDQRMYDLEQRQSDFERRMRYR